MKHKIAAGISRVASGSALLLALFSSPAFSATITVTSTADSGAGTLRQAITDAASGDAIAFSLVYPATITLSSTLTLNKNLTIKGPGAANLTLSGNSTVRVIDATSGTIAISDMTIANGSVNGSGQNGAGFRLSGSVNLTIDRCVIRNHVLSGGTNRGAGFYVPSTATLTVHRSYIHSNSTPTTYVNEGGAFYSDGDLTVTNSTIANNACYFGAALNLHAASGKTITLANCTVSGNNSAIDGVIAHNSTGAMNLTNCTVTNNVSGQYEAGLFADAGSLTLRNTVIAANLPTSGMGDTDIFIDTSGIYGGDMVAFSSFGYNLIGSTGSQAYTWTVGDVVGNEAGKQNPNLGSLADNGGYVPSHDPNSGSQAINPASSNGAPFVDSRGYLRSGTADKGAHEDSGAPPVATSAGSINMTSFAANWNSASGAAGYYLDVALDAGFTVWVSGYRDLDVGNTLTYSVIGLSEGTTYYYRIRGYNTYQTYYSNTVNVTTQTGSPTSTKTFTPTRTSSATATPTATSTASQSASATPSQTATLTSTASQSASATPSRTATPTSTRSATDTATPTNTSTASQSASATPSRTATPTFASSATVTATPTNTSTASQSATATMSRTITFTATPSTTSAATSLTTPVMTATATFTVTPLSTAIATCTATAWRISREITVYPNPARGQVRFILNPACPTRAKIIIMNLAGEQVAMVEESLLAGPGTVTWQCRGVAPGIYLARVLMDGEEISKTKIAVVK